MTVLNNYKKIIFIKMCLLGAYVYKCSLEVALYVCSLLSTEAEGVPGAAVVI